MDFTIFQQVNGFAAGHDAFEDVLRFFSVDAPYLFVALLAGLFLARGKWESQNARHGVIAAGLSAALALGVAQLLAAAWERPRPYVTHPDVAHLFIAPTPDPSFPSDHATAAFAIAVAIALRSRRAGILALAMATVVAVSRVAVGAHYPSDVIAGALLGSLSALLLYLPAVRRPLHRLADAVGDIYERLVGWALAGIGIAGR